MEDGRVLVVGPPAERGGCLPTLTEELARRWLDVRDVALAPPTTAAQVEADLGEATGDEWVRAVVWAPVDAPALAATPLGDDDGWDDRCDALLLVGLHVARAAHGLLADGGGRFVAVLPDVGIGGAAGQVALATALEGLRALVKSAARQWAEVGITTATVLAPAAFFDPDADPAASARVLAEPDAEDVANVVAALLGPAGDALTGTTLPVDGGVLMVP